MRKVSAVVTVVPGAGKPQRIEVPNVEGYSIQQALDLDADTFSVDIGDSAKRLTGTLDRDTEVRVDLFCVDDNGHRHQAFSGIADMALGGTLHVTSLSGRDSPSVIMDTDAEPGRWGRQKPHVFLAARAKKLGISSVQIADMKELRVIFTDSTEKEWAFWYRIVRGAGMYMWATPAGKLVVDHLGYSPSKFSYSFGIPPVNNKGGGTWIPVSDVTIGSNKQSRIYKSLLYGEDAKKGNIRIGRSVDNRIKNWKRKPTRTITTATIRTQQAMNDEAHTEVFEGIVGAQEHTLTVRDTGIPIALNTMCRVNLPQYGLVGHFFIVGLTRQGGQAQFEQVIRLRERSFAMTKRVPDAPTLEKTDDPSIENKPIGTLSRALEVAGIPYGASFIRAAIEFGEPAGWNVSYYAGVLMAIAQVESGFQNVREGDSVEWYPKPTEGAQSPEASARYQDLESHGIVIAGAGSIGERLRRWEQDFANSKGNPDNPYASRSASGGEAGVGIMQLTSLNFKQWADEYGWNGKTVKGELAGGRWSPDSNIRAAARVLANSLVGVGANSTKPESIWQGVGAYHAGVGGSQGAGTASAAAYSQKVKAGFATFYANAKDAITNTQPLPAGSAVRSWNIPGHGVVNAPDGTPNQVAKAITWALARVGSPYVYGGGGQKVPANSGRYSNMEQYDCSSFAMGAYTFTTPSLMSVMNGPTGSYHGNDTTFTLYAAGRFQYVAKDDLKVGDWVFFYGVEHMGIYLGDGLVVHDGSSAPGEVRVAGLNDFSTYDGARRVIRSPVAGVPKPEGSVIAGDSTGSRRVMIQAGHDPGGHGDQPYGHTGQSGAPEEVDFNIAVRDIALAYFAKDPRFDAVKGDAWSASAGAVVGTSDDINYAGDVFISIHYDANTAGGSRYFFGYPTGHTDSLEAQSLALAEHFSTFYEQISGHPTRNVGMDNSNEALFGYYAWGDVTRAPPDNIDHTPGVKARLLIEMGEGGTGGADRDWLFSAKKEIAAAIYKGVCQYFGLKAQP